MSKQNLQVHYQAHRESHIKRRNLAGEGKSIVEYVPCGSLQPTRVEAMREFIGALEPSLKSADDSTIWRHWPSMQRNHSVRIQRLIEFKPKIPT